MSDIENDQKGGIGQERVYVSEIQRFCVHDGPGIRTVVFVLGCPLRCKWCQNPENMKPVPQLLFSGGGCIGCGACVPACPRGANTVDGDEHCLLDRKACTACGRCAEVCQPGARKLSGTPYTVDEVYEEIIKDRVVYSNTGGGVTLSGGEFAMYPDFARRLLERCKRENIHTALETCGYVKWEAFERIAPYTDLFLYDIKALDQKTHKEWTGVDNKQILENLSRLPSLGKEIIARVPLVPGVNDDEGEFTGIVELVRSLDSVRGLHIMPFHHIGRTKYEMLDKPYLVGGLKEPDERLLERCRDIAKTHGLLVDIGGSDCFTAVEKKRAKRDERFFIYDF
ncbi:MAG: glycyl-radical enzyme activating protein [Spirochaetes bacterium]|nr:glycyl-radical enzyme activating protein [Spirochaetota bacterium]